MKKNIKKKEKERKKERMGLALTTESRTEERTQRGYRVRMRFEIETDKSNLVVIFHEQYGIDKITCDNISNIIVNISKRKETINKICFYLEEIDNTHGPQEWSRELQNPKPEVKFNIAYVYEYCDRIKKNGSGRKRNKLQPVECDIVWSVNLHPTFFDVVASNLWRTFIAHNILISGTNTESYIESRISKLSRGYLGSLYMRHHIDTIGLPTFLLCQQINNADQTNEEKVT